MTFVKDWTPIILPVGTAVLGGIATFVTLNNQVDSNTDNIDVIIERILVLEKRSIKNQVIIEELLKSMRDMRKDVYKGR